MSDTQTPPAPAPAPTAPWHAGKADAEIVGTWQNKGWGDSDPANIAIEATKAYREAQKFIGVPPDQIVRLPKDAADEAGWNAVWARLGAPADAAGYDFSTVKRADGSAPDAALTDFLRENVARLRLPKDKAGDLAQALVKHLDGQSQTQAAVRAADLENQKAQLTKDWGANYAANEFVAKQAAAALKVSPEAISALEGQVGYAAVMEMFRTIGTKIGEDKFVSGGAAQGGGPMSVEQAKAQKSELMADRAWAARYLAGGFQEVRQMTALNTMIAGAM